jgi:hypothetical protein
LNWTSEATATSFQNCCNVCWLSTSCKGFGFYSSESKCYLTANIASNNKQDTTSSSYVTGYFNLN